METITITAASVNVEPTSLRTVDVELEMTTEQRLEVLSSYTPEEIISFFGVENILFEMEDNDIIGYLNEIGVKTEWEE